MWQLLKLGVTLTEQGYPDPPAVLCDWLIAIDAEHGRAQREAANRT